MIRAYINAATKAVTRAVIPGSGLNRIPFYTDALFWLDGTIITVGEAKYFRDKSPNARHFLITDYDFDSTWKEGMPYKTASTISAPAADAELIAADINNYLYASDGTPNQLPVISLFQDVDYEHRLFCRHKSQIVDANGVEVYEPRVMDVALYSNIKADADLITCQTYYSVPVEVTENVKWVDAVNGLDTNVGTKAEPYKTLTKATSTVTNNTIYVKSGNYSEVYAGSLYYWYILNPNNIKGVGLVSLKSTATDRLLFTVGSASSVIGVNGFILDGEGTTDDLVVTYGNSSTITLEKIYFKGVKTRVINPHTNTPVTVRSCVCSTDTEKLSTYSNDITIDGCYFKNIRSTCKLTALIKNSRIITTVDGMLAMYNDKMAMTVIGNNITSSGACVYLTGGAMDASKNVSIQYNTLNIVDKTVSGSVFGVYAGGEGSKYTLTIKNNSINQLKAGALTSAPAPVWIVDQVAPEISHNIIVINGTTVVNGIYHQLTGAVISGINKINYNRIISQSLTGAILSIGFEEGIKNLADESEIIGNVVFGYKRDNPTANGTTHGMLINCGKNMIIKYNYVGYCNVGIAAKTGLEDTYTSGGIFYNLLEDNSNHLWIRGINGINIFNNTFKESAVTYTDAYVACIHADENSAVDGNQFSKNVICKNNIFDVDKSTGKLIWFDTDAVTGSIVTDSIVKGSGAKIVAGANTYTTLAESQAAGWMADCAESDPLLTNLIPSVAISGADLGVDYNTGLDITSNLSVPVIVTKAQPATWQKGAYVI